MVTGTPVLVCRVARLALCAVPLILAGTAALGQAAAMAPPPPAAAAAAAAGGAPAVAAAAAPAAAGAAPAAVTAAADASHGQTEADEYTRYELLAPDSASFHILYEVTATTPGAAVFFNPIRKGSTASGEAIFDQATSHRLRFEEVSGQEARSSGLPEAELEMRYLRIHLERPVPPEGGARLLIEKTYRDPQSYLERGVDRIVFTRPLGIHRNSIVLPAGYELTSCNIPSQVLAGPDGRTTVSFLYTGPEAAPLTLIARRLPASAAAAAAASVATPAGAGPAVAPPAMATPAAAPPASPAAPAGASPYEERLAERAHQDRTIVYFLRQPETHAFDLYHDYTESRAGTDKYLNVVRPGSAASQPAARNLDTGEALAVETLKGDALRHANLSPAELREVAEVGGQIGDDTEVVIARFAALRKGESLRLRISETYTDPRRYRLDGDVLVFDRTFGRPRDAVVLPAGWYLTASSIPATVTEAGDGRIRLDFVNPRPDEIAVLIEARRR
jgi:hypothetical protein